MPMILVHILVVLIVVAVLLFVLERVVPDAAILQIIRVVILACVLIWLLFIFMGELNTMGYPVLRR